MPRLSHSSRFYHPHDSGWAVQIIKLLIMKFSPFPCYLVPLSPSTPYSQTPSAYIPTSMSATKFHTHKCANCYLTCNRILAVTEYITISTLKLKTVEQNTASANIWGPTWHIGR
jgi:hypothetical protein